MVTGKTLAKLRKIHLYLGVILTPLVIFFALSGAVQSFHLHAPSKKQDADPPPALFAAAAEVHTNQRLENGMQRSRAFASLAALAAVALVATSVLGVIMAFRFVPDGRIVWALLALGFVLPLLLLWTGSL